MNRYIGSVLLAAMLVSCEGPAVGVKEVPGKPAVESDGAAPVHRVFPRQVLTFRHVRFAGDSLPASPTLIAARGDTLLVAGQDNVITAFDGKGTRLWTFGRKGRGPSEFSRIRDLEPTERGVAAYDPVNGRITEIDPRGMLLQEINLAEVPRGDQFAPLRDHRFAIVTASPSERRNVVVVDTVGRVVGSLQWPWTAYDSLDPIARQVVTAVATSGDWAAGFRLGDGWYSLSDTAVVGAVHPFARHVDFPALIVEKDQSGRTSTHLGRAEVAAMTIALSGKSLFVLFGGTGDSAFRIVDVHDAVTGKYKNSILLPNASSGVAVGTDLMVSIVTDPEPGLDILPLER